MAAVEYNYYSLSNMVCLFEHDGYDLAFDCFFVAIVLEYSASAKLLTLFSQVLKAN